MRHLVYKVFKTSCTITTTENLEPKWAPISPTLVLKIESKIIVYSSEILYPNACTLLLKIKFKTCRQYYSQSRTKLMYNATHASSKLQI